MGAPLRSVPHRPGTTRAAYSKDGKYIFTTGADCVVRRFKNDSNEEPLLLDPLHDEGVTSIAVSNQKLVTCSEDGEAAIFDIEGGESSKICRSTLPMREIAISPDGEWIAIASDEIKVKIVNIQDMLKVMELTASLARSIKHVAFHPSGNMISAVDTNGAIRIYSLSTETPSIIETLTSIVPIVQDPESPLSCKVAWHPDGSCFASPTPTREILVFDRISWQRQFSFDASDGHKGPITDIAWSPNGAYLASCAQDNLILIWEAKTGNIILRLPVPLYALQVVWHPTQNALSWTTNEGELYTQEDLISTSRESPSERPIRPSPVALKQITSAASAARSTKVTNGTTKGHQESAGPKEWSMEDEAVQSDLENAGADWIDDDDGAGYIPNLNDRHKRPVNTGYDSDGDDRPAKRSKTRTTSERHPPIQPGSTPWKNQRRYLNLNMIGWIWTVEQDDHNSITVEFHDREAHRQYHFTDPALYSFAALSDEGALFASNTRTEHGEAVPAVIHYRPHDSWASYSNWSISLPFDEDIEAIALSNQAVVVCTNKGYVRTYSLHGLPRRIIQAKYAPIIGAITHGNYVMIVANGPAQTDGTPSLVYSIVHTKREEVFQNNDVVALAPGSAIRSMFFGEDGNPYIYSTKGVLSVLTKWTSFGQAQWTPLLDTNLLARRVGKDENYWPVAVVENKFHCIILKGADRHPYFPRPITSEFDFLMPITIPDHQDNSQASLETTLAQNSLFLGMAEDIEDHDEKTRLEALVDRSLLQLLNLACKNEQDARALDICESLTRTSSLDAAVKIAGHHNRINLAERIGWINTS